MQPSVCFRQLKRSSLPSFLQTAKTSNFIARCGDDQAGRILRPIWDRPILKRDAHGIHGTLYYEYEGRRKYLPATKREVDWDQGAINSAQRRLFASKR